MQKGTVCLFLHKDRDHYVKNKKVDIKLLDADMVKATIFNAVISIAVVVFGIWTFAYGMNSEAPYSIACIIGPIISYLGIRMGLYNESRIDLEYINTRKGRF